MTKEGAATRKIEVIRPLLTSKYELFPGIFPLSLESSNAVLSGCLVWRMVRQGNLKGHTAFPALGLPLSVLSQTDNGCRDCDVQATPERNP